MNGFTFVHDQPVQPARDDGRARRLDTAAQLLGAEARRISAEWFGAGAGFTITELLVAVAVVAVLLGLGVPSIRRYIEAAAECRRAELPAGRAGRAGRGDPAEPAHGVRPDRHPGRDRQYCQRSRASGRMGRTGWSASSIPPGAAGVPSGRIEVRPTRSCRQRGAIRSDRRRRRADSVQRHRSVQRLRQHGRREQLPIFLLQNLRRRCLRAGRADALPRPSSFRRAAWHGSAIPGQRPPPTAAAAELAMKHAAPISPASS